MLKYKLACNQTVFMVRKASKLREEFFYEALHHGSEIFYIKEDLSDLWEVIEEALSPADGLPAGARAARVAAGGRRVADTYLSRRGIDCYVMLYLQRYYFPCARASKCRGGSCDVSPSSIALSRAAGDGGRLCASSDIGELRLRARRDAERGVTASAARNVRPRPSRLSRAPPQILGSMAALLARLLAFLFPPLPPHPASCSALSCSPGAAHEHTGSVFAPPFVRGAFLRLPSSRVRRARHRASRCAAPLLLPPRRPPAVAPLFLPLVPPFLLRPAVCE
ncbi:unnamed protein product [Prorocentrum cordatum]|uniref:Uncharacterized protein n=1 Tax=Prorocentrum cordatum TaxID=2364126 RepID=A0ABN9VQ83_9DINO|nr:unnamed protein product [Polarella glacialis]